MSATAAMGRAAEFSQLAELLGQLGVGASAFQIDQLLDYRDLLARWNRVYNLTALRDPQQMLVLHLADCLAVLPALTQLGPRRLLDVGTGGGLPGLVIAILLPQVQVVLNDAVQKKCAFLRQVAATLKLSNVEVVHGRVETLDLPLFDCITSRAFSELALLIRLTAHLLAPGGCWAAMKGVEPNAELAALPPGLQAEVMPLHVPGLDASRCLVWIRRTTPSNSN